MKKIIISIAIILLWFYNHTTFANNQAVIQKVSWQLQLKIQNSGPEVKIKYENLLKKYISILKDKPEKKEVFEKILKNILISDFSKYFQKHTQSFSIDHNEIKKYWLELHNEKRKNYWYKSYTYNQKLENTAIEWSYNNYYKQSMDHKRNSTDGWYDYYTVKNWFQERWAVCPVVWRFSETESIAHYGFYCSDGNCDDEFKESLKEIFDIYYAEKWLKYPADAHYRAIVWKDLWELWVWYTLYQSDLDNYFEYYLTTHYCTKVK